MSEKQNWTPEPLEPVAQGFEAEDGYRIAFKEPAIAKIPFEIIDIIGLSYLQPDLITPAGPFALGNNAECSGWSGYGDMLSGSIATAISGFNAEGSIVFSGPWIVESLFSAIFSDTVIVSEIPDAG